MRNNLFCDGEIYYMKSPTSRNNITLRTMPVFDPTLSTIISLEQQNPSSEIHVNN